MEITNHAKIRGLERLLDIKLEGKDDASKLASNPELNYRIEMFLNKAIKPSNAFKLTGVKYKAMIDGFDNYRAVIRVNENGKQVLISIVPIQGA